MKKISTLVKILPLALLTINGGNALAAKEGEVTKEKMEKSIRTIYGDVLSNHKIDLLNTFLAPNVISDDGTAKITGKEPLINLIKERSEAIDLRYEIDDLVVDPTQKLAFVRWHATGKANKDFAGFKAGKMADYWGFSEIHFDQKGLIDQNWSLTSVVEVPSK